MIDVISEFVPFDAALRFERAPAAVVEPVPPCATVNAVVNPVIEVMSEFAPLAAAPSAVRAAEVVVAPVPPFAIGSAPVTSEVRSTFAAVNAFVPFPRTIPVRVVAPVPPWATLNAVVNPVSEVISEFAPLDAALKFVRAPDAVVEPVPP